MSHQSFKHDLYVEEDLLGKVNMEDAPLWFRGFCFGFKALAIHIILPLQGFGSIFMVLSYHGLNYFSQCFGIRALATFTGLQYMGLGNFQRVSA